MNMRIPASTTKPTPKPKLAVGRARRRQSGIATVLVILLTGLALTTVVLGAVGYIGGLQARSVSLHAATQAQLQAWSAQEAARQYLSQIGGTAAGALTANTPMTFASSYLSNVSAKVTAVTANDATFCGGSTRVQMTFAGKGGPANSTLESVLCVSNAVSATPGLAGDSSTLRGGLSISGTTTLVTAADVGTDKLSVEGDITNGSNGGNALSGFTSVSSTGNIDLAQGGANDINFVQANGYIKIQGKFTSLTAIGNITTVGGATTASTILSNAAVEIMQGTNPATISYGTIQATGNVTFDQSVGVGTVETQGNIITLGANTTNIQTSAKVQGNYTEQAGFSSATQVASGQYKGTLTLVPSHSGVNMTKNTGLTVSVPTVTPITAASNPVDAYFYKSAANYVFDVDGSGNPTVTVNAVSGLNSGTTYYLVGSGGNQDYLCTTTTFVSGPTCPKKICNGSSAYNSCFTLPNAQYNPNNWAISGTGSTQATTTMAPGVYWFKGNLTVNSGYYVSTFIATGNLTTGGNNTIVDPAWGGSSGVCSNAMFLAMYPTNMCVSSNYVDSAIANVALLSGGKVNSVFSGGVITLGASTKVYGNVIAGDTLVTMGSTTVYGVFSAQHGSNSASTNSFAAATKFDQTNLKVYPGTGTGGGAGGAAAAQVLFSHYQ